MSLTVERPGVYSTLQDVGRLGLRYLGIPWSGVGCEPWMRFANALLNQDLATPVIETIEGGLTLKVLDQDVNVAIVGDVRAERILENGSKSAVQGWRATTLKHGDTLTIVQTGRYRCAVVGIQGLTIKTHFGSASTYASAALGGLNGRLLQAGDELPLNSNLQTPTTSLGQFKPFFFTGEPASVEDEFVVRAVAGPQDDAFTEKALNTFFSATYHISQDIDRMGARLNGPALEHRSESHRDLVSDAILPGSVQVPGIGTPIVMLADAHTIGGYPKIATVVSADRALFSLVRPGSVVRFEQVTPDEAREHTLFVERSVLEHLGSKEEVPSDPLNTERLLRLNLIDGVSNALNSES